MKNYAIITGTRTGSSHLCDLLTSVWLGSPDEYFNPCDMERYCAEFPGNYDNYGQRIIDHTATHVFGVKLNHPEAIREAQKSGIEFGYWIRLRRKDKLMQAVSRYIAWYSGRWKSYETAKQVVPYSKDGISRAHETIIQEELWLDVFLHGKNVLEVEYEELCADETATILRIADFLGEEINVDLLSSRHSMIRNEENYAWVERYLAE